MIDWLIDLLKYNRCCSWLWQYTCSVVLSCCVIRPTVATVAICRRLSCTASPAPLDHLLHFYIKGAMIWCRGGHSNWTFSLSSSFSFLPSFSLFFIPRFPLSFPPFLLLSFRVGPLKSSYRRSGGALWAPSDGSGVVHLSLKILYLVAAFWADRSWELC